MISFLPMSISVLLQSIGIEAEDWYDEIIFSIVYGNSLMNPIIYLIFTRRKIYKTFKGNIPRCCDKYATSNDTSTDTRDSETVSNDTNISNEDPVNCIKSKKDPISMSNIKFASDRACSSLNSSDSGIYLAAIFKLQADVGDDNTFTSTKAQRKGEDEHGIQAETIYD